MPSIKHRPIRRKSAPIRAGAGWAYKLADGRYGLDAVTAVSPTMHGDRFSIEFPFAAQLGRDRVGDYLRLAGIRTENHQLNPVAYVDHGTWQPLPIGKCESPSGEYRVWIDEAAGLAWAEVYLSHAVPEAEQVYALYEEKVLRAGSIGYRALVTQPLSADPMQGWNGGRKEGPLDLIEVELLEASICGLPCNGDAVRRALTVNWAGKSLLPSLRAALRPLASPSPVWSPGATLGVTSMAKKDLAGADVPTNDPAADPAGADNRVPHGAQVLGDLHGMLSMALAHIGQESGVIDNPSVKEHLTGTATPAIQDAVKGLADHFAKEYPDLEPLDSGDEDEAETDDDKKPEGEGKETKDEEPAEDDDEDDKSTEETKTLRPWRKTIRRRGAPKGKKTSTKVTKPQTKRLTKATHGQIKDAADWLGDHGDAENLTREQKTCARYHAKCLKDMADAQGGDAPAAASDDMDADTSALVMKALDNMDKKLGATETRIKRATGKV